MMRDLSYTLILLCNDGNKKEIEVMGYVPRIGEWVEYPIGDISFRGRVSDVTHAVRYNSHAASFSVTTVTAVQSY